MPAPGVLAVCWRYRGRSRARKGPRQVRYGPGLAVVARISRHRGLRPSSALSLVPAISAQARAPAGSAQEDPKLSHDQRDHARMHLVTCFLIAQTVRSTRSSGEPTFKRPEAATRRSLAPRYRHWPVPLLLKPRGRHGMASPGPCAGPGCGFWPGAVPEMTDFGTIGWARRRAACASCRGNPGCGRRRLAQILGPPQQRIVTTESFKSSAVPGREGR